MEKFQFTRFSASCSLDPRYQSEYLDAIIADPDRAVEEGVSILKHDRTTTVALTASDRHRWIIKRYNTKNLWHGLRRAVRRSRASNCWHMSTQFKRAGVAVPAPVACLEMRFGPLRGKSYFINEFVEAEDLLTYVAAHQSETGCLRQNIVKLFQHLILGGINHGDLKATNILVAPHGLVLLDLDAAKRPGNSTLFRQGYRKDRSRFLKNWLDYAEMYAYFDAALPQEPGAVG